MKKKYVLLKSEKYKLIISLEEIDFDYYTDVCVELIFDKKSIILFKDNLLALKNITEQYSGNIVILDNNLDESKLGILLNNYYMSIYENEIQDNLILDNQEYWTGEKYCCYVSLEYATWIYYYGGSIVMKVTPVFNGFENEGYVQEYYKFIQEYKDIFQGIVSLQQLIYVKKVVLKLYNELF